jgi:hypothetical protein
MRLLTKEQTFRAFRKALRDYPGIHADQIEDVLWEYLDDKAINYIFVEILEDLYEADYLTYDELEASRDAMILYYGDLVKEFIRQEYE